MGPAATATRDVSPDSTCSEYGWGDSCHAAVSSVPYPRRPRAMTTSFAVPRRGRDRDRLSHTLSIRAVGHMALVSGPLDL